jgi:AraC family transcriptional regulator
MFARADLHVNRYDAHLAMAPHRHDTASINLVVDGGFHERIGRSERDYAAGHVAFCPAGAVHSQRFGAGATRQIIFAPRPDWLAYLADCRMELDAAPHAREAAFRQMAIRLLAELEQGDDFSALACEGILLEIVAAFGRRKALDVVGALPPAWLAAARDFIHAHACDALSMARIAGAAGRHEIHLAREFRRYFGVSIGAYQRRLRVERAAALLAEGQREISQIALACGFAGHSHLCRVFKAQYGVAPSRYRDQVTFKRR